jgi:PAS domain S-box-containing protein
MRDPASDSRSNPDEIAALVQTFHETQRRLQELTEGRLDTVLAPDSPFYALEQTRQRLRQSEEQFRNMFNSAAIGIAISTPEGRFLRANAAYCTMLGYSEAEMLEMNFADVTHPVDLTLNLELRDELLAGARDSFVMEKRYLKKGGEVVWTRHSVSATHTDSREIATLLVIAEDITERRRIEDELKRKQARYQRLVDSNVQGVMFWRRDGKVSGANDAFLKLVRHSREELEAGLIDWRALTPPEYASRDAGSMAEIDAHGIGLTYEKEFVLRDGTRVPILLGGAAFEDDPDEGVCFVLDLTERKKLEQQFFRAQRLESIGTLASGLAHDLNNILAPISISAELLKANTHDRESTAMLEAIELSAKRGGEIVQQVLSFTRGVTSERTELKAKLLLDDLGKIIKDTFPKDIRLQFHIPNDAWALFGDATQVHQVLLNLCVNARDAMPNGGVLTLSVDNCDLEDQTSTMNIPIKAGRYVRISVTDSGTGMPKEILEKIFEPFFTTKDLSKGTGLGLSTVVAILRSHEGAISVYSEPGKGTTFNVYLPAAETVSAGVKPKVKSAELARGNGETILVVDDESALLAVIGKALRTYGYQILTARDGAEGVAIYARNLENISVVLTDLTMPGMSGGEMIHALRRMNPELKVIASSGLHSQVSATAAIPGVKHFLTKPYVLHTLLKTLQNVMFDG